MSDFGYTIIIPAILFISFLLIGFGGGKLKPVISGIAGIISVSVAAILSWITAYNYFFISGKVSGAYQSVIPFNTLWLKFTDRLYIDMGILLDPISVMMLVVISTVSLMVHIYSIGYMKGKKGFSRYFAFLSLFTFSMTGLVISTNIFQTYIFWELVGISSYLLIGFYYDKPSAVAAAKKAFIVTRFADLGFLVGILVLSSISGTFDFAVLNNPNGSSLASGTTSTFLGMSALTWSLILIYMGCAGKSAMFPLHIWLPDAMEGPTPVSALIHAATMVVAGVYLVARLFPVYAFFAPDALEVVAVVGVFTSLFAALIATTQTDIKRVLAFSTISQIGLMMAGIGVAGYGGEAGLGYMASMFHLFTHAMFKALLFLCAGSVIHAVHTNEIFEMGGLRKYLPYTHITFLIACLAIAGIPPLSGFFSKDEIMTAGLQKSSIIFIAELVIAGLTAFYMFRLYFIVFWNRETKYDKTPHESPIIMIIPLIILAAGSAFAGFIPFGSLVTSNGKPIVSHIHLEVALPALAFALTGIGISYVLYKKERVVPKKISSSMISFRIIVSNKFYIDQIYIFVTKKIIFNLVSTPVAWFDRHIVDGTMNAIAYLTNSVSEKIKGFQSGQLQQYAYVMISGAVLILFLIFYLLK